jgi:hypothetical protein
MQSDDIGITELFSDEGDNSNTEFVSNENNITY